MCLKHLFDLLCILFGDTLLEQLRDRLDELFGLNRDQMIIREKNVHTPERKESGADTHLDEGEVRHNRLDLFNDLRLGTSVERLELHVENCLFLRLGSFLCRRVVHGCGTRTGRRNRCTRRRERDFLNVQTRLERIERLIFLIRKGEPLSLTLRSVTRSAAWSSVRPDMSSTILCSAGSDDGVGAAGGGGIDDDEGDASVVAAVASARVARRPVGVPRVVRDLCTGREKVRDRTQKSAREGCWRRHFCAPLSGGGAEGERQTILHIIFSLLFGRGAGTVLALAAGVPVVFVTLADPGWGTAGVPFGRSAARGFAWSCLTQLGCSHSIFHSNHHHPGSGMKCNPKLPFTTSPLIKFLVFFFVF